MSELFFSFGGGFAAAETKKASSESRFPASENKNRSM